MRIALITTGGTIASSTQDNAIKLTKPNSDLLINNLKKATVYDLVTIDTKACINVLSEELNAQHWQQMIACIQAIDTQKYDAIILSHGSDTLGFTAAILGYYFALFSLPIVLISSHAPLQNPHATGYANFTASVEFLHHTKPKGVFVAYTLPLERTTSIYNATQFGFIAPMGDVHTTPFDACAVYQNGQIKHYFSPQNLPTLFTLNPPSSSLNILVITPHPLLDYSAFDIKAYDAIVHGLYHSGTTQTKKALALMHACQSARIPLFFAPLAHKTDYYDSTATLLKHGAHFVKNHTFEAAYAKVVLGLSSDLNLTQLQHWLDS